MGTAARLQLQRFNFDSSQRAAALHSFAYASGSQLLHRPVLHGHRTVCIHNIICSGHRCVQNFLRRFPPAYIDGANIRAQMKRNCRQRKSRVENRGQNVLPGVLLHMIEAPIPINTSLHRTNFNRLVDNMEHFLFFVDHIDDTRISNQPRIVGLAAGGGIKRGAIQFYAPRCYRPGSPPKSLLRQRRGFVVLVELAGSQLKTCALNSCAKESS